jgi:hypothetical protein
MVRHEAVRRWAILAVTILVWSSFTAIGSWRFGLAVAAQDFGCPFRKLHAPGRDLMGLDVDLLGQFGQRLLALDCGKRDVRCGGRALAPARSSRPGLSCSRHHADLGQKLH